MTHSRFVGALVLIAANVAACNAAEKDGSSRSMMSDTAAAMVASGAPAAPDRAVGEAAASADVRMQKIGGVAGAGDRSASRSPITSSALPAAGQIAPGMLIRTGTATIEVERLDPAVTRLRQLATQLGGYVANSSMLGGREQVRSATLELKIPAARFDQAISGLGTVGRVESVNSTAEDVGEEFVDVTARMNNAKRLEERLVALLATRTGRLEDVLAVERELARVREEIERYEGRLRFLSTRAAVSTLTVTLHEPLPLLGQSPGENPIVSAFRRAGRNFIALIAGFIGALGVIIPLGVILAAGWLLYRRYVRRDRGR